ncbi:MAG TPA: PAS domain-containing protein [Vicinamibacteria bacterium]|nr:PAS domain-containing protein [Vicinamibacteria bacterium]
MSEPSLLPREEAIARMEAYQEALAQAFARGPAHYDALFEKPPSPIAAHEIDAHKVITRVNAVELQLLGYRPEQMIGRPVLEFVVMQEVGKRAIERKLAETGEIKPFVRSYVRADGSAIPVLIVDRQRRDTAGRVVGMRTVMMQTAGL